MHVIKATEWDILCYLFTLFPKSTLHYCLLFIGNLTVTFQTNRNPGHCLTKVRLKLYNSRTEFGPESLVMSFLMRKIRLAKRA